MAAPTSSVASPNPPVPFNTIIRQQTQIYLSTVDPANPPQPHVIEQELLSQVNNEIDSKNQQHKKRGQLSYLKTLTNAQIADIMLHLHNICRIAPAGKNTDSDYDLVAIYVNHGVDEGIFVTADDTFRTIAQQYNYNIDTNSFNEVMASLKIAAPRRYRCHDRDLIAVNNGIFDYRTKELKPFTSELVFLAKSRVDYVAGAVSPVITHPVDGTNWEVEEWVASLSDDPEVVELLWEILGAIIRPHVRWNKSAWFFSERGNNGKGTLCELMRNLCGPTSFASIPIADFGKDFMLEPLTRATAIIVDENDVGTFIDRAANLKAVITNDVISINRKYKTPIAYQFYGFMVQCLNEFPRIKDKSESFYRRQLFVPFEKNFAGIERRYIKDDYLHRKEVLEYVLHRVMHMDYYVLSEPEATKNVLSQYKDFNDPVRAFWSEFKDQFVWDLLPFAFLYDLYRSWFAANNPSGSPLGKQGFISDLVNIIDGDDTWYANAKRDTKVRPAKRMDLPETLIAKYDLKAWFNPTYSGPDPEKKSMPLKAINYAGLLRYSSNTGIIGIVPSDDDEDDQDSDDLAGGAS